ncbi:hypothetical protein EWM64_g5565 [Hericium alpestre]|uniref:HhH-GPD domain-containing protein n=1 Tax=Hericium alpestre TaxID=135208 RepID=A0A4Y9ZYF0_9AGAM|nr:hypothetical protein EWM64_g5565 [Hericium alpestre]
MEINGSRNKPLSFTSRFFASIAGSKHVKPPSSVDTLAKETLLALTGDADGGLREEHARLMDCSPGYSFYFLSYLDRHRRLLAAKPVLIQESVAEDPWRVLVAVMLLNKTAGRHAIPVFWSIMERWPSAEAMADADVAELVECIPPAGTAG